MRKLHLLLATIALALGLGSALVADQPIPPCEPNCGGGGGGQPPPPFCPPCTPFPPCEPDCSQVVASIQSGYANSGKL